MPSSLPPSSPLHDDLTATLVLRLRGGDTQAAELLEHLYREPLRRFCVGYLGASDADDAVQEVFYKVLKAGDVPENFRAWLYRIARHHCIDVLRVRHRRPAPHGLPASAQLDARLTGALTKLVRSEDRAELPAMLRSLTDAQREVLSLRYTEGLSRAEIAEVLDVPEAIVKSRLYEGVERLRTRGGGAGGEAEAAAG